jgi:exodeoxyribonuclease V alpha subunit
MPSLQPGETIRCQGQWKMHSEYGMQFEVKAFELQAPSDLLGIQKYLESGMIKGIGPAYAERIVKRFGLTTLDVIEKEPERLLDIAGLGKKRVERIKSCWHEQQAIRTVMIFLRGHKVSPAFAHKIFKKYGDASIQKVQENPFRLAQEIHGIGFKSADQIAQGLGMPLDAPERLEAGITHTLWELSSDGHVCYPLEGLIPEVEKILEAPAEKIQARVEALIERGDLVQEGERVWVKPLFLSEVAIAKELARLVQSLGVLRAVHIEKALEWVQQKLHIELAPEQKEAVGLGVQEKILIVTGGPGTGKSTITKAILAITEKLTSKIVLTAPTGKAAKRMQEITGKHASTIHALLEMDFKTGLFKKNRDNPLEGDLIIVDEASMIDTQLMMHLLRAVPSTARLILIGDIYQLPSVGPGNVLKDLICSERIGVIQLKKIFRQAAGSQIITNAHKINQGEFPDLTYHPKGDFQFIEAEEAEEVLSIIIDLVCNQLPRTHRFHLLDDIQVLCPMKRGVIGCDNLNSLLQKKINPSPTPLVRMGRCFHIGDKVMQIRNNYEKQVYNGDVGRIVELDLSDEVLTVNFDGRLVSYDFTEVDELILAYAVSIHKYQGSECPCVIIPVHTAHYMMLFRNLLYTGLTRGKKRAIFVGTKKALSIAVRNEEVLRRHTGLQEAARRYLSARGAALRLFEKSLS